LTPSTLPRREGGSDLWVENPLIYGKKLEYLTQINPKLRRVALLWNPAATPARAYFEATKDGARRLNLQLQSVEVRRPKDLDGGFAAMSRRRAEGVIVVADPVTFLARTQIAQSAARYALPVVASRREFVEAGALLSYGPHPVERWRRAAFYVDKLLRGANAAELPVEQPSTFELVINLKVAKSLGLTIPQSLLLQADQGQFQVSEMLGDEWKWWKELFVSTVPARSRILEPDIPTVVTGPRGCGKTMLFRRLSERLTVECGPVDSLPDAASFVGLYINANDIADAFAHFPEKPTDTDTAMLVCYANLCVLSDLLAVESARLAKLDEAPPPDFLASVRDWLIDPKKSRPLVVGEDPLERYRSALEDIKWRFPKGVTKSHFPGFKDLAQHAWLRRLISLARRLCPWISSKTFFIFIDDYTTPRVSVPMQRVLNRMLFQRSNDFVCKVATESATTFVPEDSSGKILQDGDDYQLIDIAEESLFLKEDERAQFLNEVFARRLRLDPRVHEDGRTLPTLLGHSGKSKTEFARLLRPGRADETSSTPVPADSQRRGATKPKVLYHGCDILTSLWSGDTRTMIQLVEGVLDEAHAPSAPEIIRYVQPEIQDRVFRNRGGQWLEAQTRNQPSDREAVERELARLHAAQPNFEYAGGSYGSHLKAVVEAFVAAARELLLGPTYRIKEGETVREVPRMAFRLEIIDEFRVSGLPAEMYKDLIRYGLFMRDARGKSVRGAMVPRLYLRRFLLPYCTLALSTRDSVQLSCASFIELLMRPDAFKTKTRQHVRGQPEPAELQLSLYDDLGPNHA
jgi:hypothetical protein